MNGQQQQPTPPGAQPPMGQAMPGQPMGGNMQFQQQQMQQQMFNQNSSNYRGGGGGFPQNNFGQQSRGGFQQNPRNMGGIAAMNFATGGQQGPAKDYSRFHSLYVGNLSSKTFDLDLYKYFDSRGYKLAGAKVMFDRDTSQSKLFGYLNFYAIEESERCLTEQANACIDGKQVILNKKKDGNFDKEANLIVLNFPKELDQAQLNALFSAHGTIKSCKLEVFNDGTSRGFGYVQYENKDSAQAAIKALNNTEQGPNKQVIQVNVQQTKDSRETTDVAKFTNLFVSNLPENFTSEQLKAIFAEFGEIRSCEVSSKNSTQGFINFATHECASKAIETISMKKNIDGKIVIVQQHVYKKESEIKGSSNQIAANMGSVYKSNIFVKYVPKNTTLDAFKDTFGKSGTILSAKLEDHFIYVGNEKISNYKKGYVLYEDVKQAQKCIQMYHETNILGFGRPIEVDFWRSKTDIKQQNDTMAQQNILQLINLQRQVNRNMNPINQMGVPNYNQGGAQQNWDNNNRTKQNQNRGRGQGYNRGRGGNNNQRGGYTNKNQNMNQQHNPNQQRGNGGGMQKPMGQMNAGAMPQPPMQGGPGAQAPQMNMGQQQQPGAPQQMQMNQQMIILPQIDISPLSNLKQPQISEFVGNSIYGLIQNALGEEFAPRITGMLLDENAGIDFKKLLTDNKYFTSKVYEAHQLILSSQRQ